MSPILGSSRRSLVRSARLASSGNARQRTVLGMGYTAPLSCSPRGIRSFDYQIRLLVQAIHTPPSACAHRLVTHRLLPCPRTALGVVRSGDSVYGPVCGRMFGLVLHSR